MGSEIKQSNLRWLLFVGLALSSFIFTGCEKGSLGVKNGTIQGHVFEYLTNKPIPDVMITAKHVAGVGGAAAQNLSQNVTTGADGLYTLIDLEPGIWDMRPTKPGYVYVVSSTTVDPNEAKVSASIQNGETSPAPIIQMSKNIIYMKGILKGYPIDAVTGSPLMNFTVKQTSPDYLTKSKMFDNATEFKENGWTGVDGGRHDYSIICENYLPFFTATGATIITNGVTDLGLIKMQPETVAITGILRNMPGFIIGPQAAVPAVDFANWVFWADAAGKQVSSQSTAVADSFKGTVQYILKNVPVTVGQVSIKCKIRGYDVVTINPAVNIPAQRPSGTISGIDLDFANIDPLRRDLRVVIQGESQKSDTPATIIDGEILRVYIKQGGKEVVPYVDVVGHNVMAEAFFSGVMAGYPLEVLVVNLTRGYISGGKTNVLLQENGESVFTIQVFVSEGGTPN